MTKTVEPNAIPLRMTLRKQNAKSRNLRTRTPVVPQENQPVALPRKHVYVTVQLVGMLVYWLDFIYIKCSTRTIYNYIDYMISYMLTYLRTHPARKRRTVKESARPNQDQDPAKEKGRSAQEKATAEPTIASVHSRVKSEASTLYCDGTRHQLQFLTN